MVEKVALEHVFYEYVGIPITIIPPAHHKLSFIYHRHCTVLTVDSIVKLNAGWTLYLHTILNTWKLSIECPFVSCVLTKDTVQIKLHPHSMCVVQYPDAVLYKQ